MKINQITEAEEPKADISARAKLDHSLRAQGHKVVPDKKKELKKGKVKHKGRIQEGPLVLNRDSDLRGMLDTLLKGWLSQGDHSDEEFEKLLNALGYRMERQGGRTVLTKEDLEEAPGAIRKGMAAIALIAGLWGVNNHMAQKAYDASPQLQKLTAYLEVAKEHGDQRMIDQLEQRIENHKMRISIGKGEVMGKDGYPIDVVYDKEKEDGGSISSKIGWNEGKVIDFPQKAQDASFSLDREIHKHAQIHAIKGKDLEKYVGKKVKIWTEGSSNAPLQRSYKIDPGKNSEGVTIEGTYYGPEEFVTHNSADDYSWKSESAANLYSDMVDSARDDEEFDEETKKDACYRKVKSRYKVWPSAYASGALVKCRKVGAKNWGNKSKK